VPRPTSKRLFAVEWSTRARARSARQKPHPLFATVPGASSQSGNGTRAPPLLADVSNTRLLRKAVAVVRRHAGQSARTTHTAAATARPRSATLEIQTPNNDLAFAFNAIAEMRTCMTIATIKN
jgi:hypothetical protein